MSKFSGSIQHGDFHALAEAAERGFDSTNGTALQRIAQTPDCIFVQTEPTSP
jgi:hypothetical protein